MNMRSFPVLRGGVVVVVVEVVVVGFGLGLHGSTSSSTEIQRKSLSIKWIR
jgi:hypothetical protein